MLRFPRRFYGCEKKSSHLFRLGEAIFQPSLQKNFLPPTNSHWEGVNHKSFLKNFSHYVWTTDGDF